MTSEANDIGQSSWGQHLRKALPYALPVILGYISIGIPCGLMEAEIGVSPLFAFLISIVFYTGSGQFMIASMALAGLPAFSIVLAVVLVSTRQMLYSAAYAPYLDKVSKRMAMYFAYTVTDETFGVNMDRYASDPSWTVEDATIVNVMSRLGWASANCVGAIAGSLVDIPTDITSFAMTSIFICLLVSQGFSKVNLAIAAAAFVAVFALKAVGLGSVAVLLGAIFSIFCGYLVMRGSPHEC